MPLKCLLDMDGVICDFRGGVEKRWGHLKMPLDVWDFVKSHPDPIEFWNSCDENFWADLDWTEDGRLILETVEGLFGKENVCLLTSPCDTYGCMEGKRKWINKWLPEYRRRFLMGPSKEFCGHSNSLLIDDCDINITQFQKQGGGGILIPRPWNRNSHVLLEYGPLFGVREFITDFFCR